ncbi:acyl-CoA N-acyltransferase [Chlamydoabsidia padenii]|nr:acyl-CoA N-acyltransferase [Chlamydoabsidia padenii]
MVNTTITTYAMMRNEIVEWSDYVAKNEWAASALKSRPSSSPVPDHCVAIYYRVDKEKKEIINKLYCTTWDSRYKSDFKHLNLIWVSRLFKVEPSDLRQLEYPEETIIMPGGDIIFVLEEDHTVAGTVAMIVHEGACELGKMTVADEHQGKGYAHPLMREGISWARRQGFPDITLVSSTTLKKAINLYKKHGFITTHLGKHHSYERCDIIMNLKLSS